MQPKESIANIPRDRIAALVVMKKNLEDMNEIEKTDSRARNEYEETLTNILQRYEHSGSPEKERELRRLVDEGVQSLRKGDKSPEM